MFGFPLENMSRNAVCVYSISNKKARLCLTLRSTYCVAGAQSSVLNLMAVEQTLFIELKTLGKQVLRNPQI